MVPRDDTRAFKLNRARSLCVIIIILTNITRIHNANGMQYQKNCIVLYCIMRPYTDGPIGPLSYRHSSGVVRNPHSTLAE